MLFGTVINFNVFSVKEQVTQNRRIYWHWNLLTVMRPRPTPSAAKTGSETAAFSKKKKPAAQGELTVIQVQLFFLEKSVAARKEGRSAPQLKKKITHRNRHSAALLMPTGKKISHRNRHSAAPLMPLHFGRVSKMRRSACFDDWFFSSCSALLLSCRLKKVEHV